MQIQIAVLLALIGWHSPVLGLECHKLPQVFGVELPSPETSHVELVRLKNGGARYKDFSHSQVFESRGVVTPKSVEELAAVIKNTQGKVSFLGGGYSMGGQIANRKGLTVDMSELNSIIDLDVNNKTITVQGGATWRQVQEKIYPHGLAVKVMQTYNNFQVGASASVNVHGRYVGYGPIISTIRKIKVALWDGRLVSASREENSDLFYGALGGYGGLGSIFELTLDLKDNVKLERRWQEFSNERGDLQAAVQEYVSQFNEAILSDPTSVMTNADIYPPDYDRLRSITYHQTDKPLTVLEHLQTPPTGKWNLLYHRWLNSMEQLNSYVKRYREHHYEPALLDEPKVVMQNWEASMDVAELTPLNQAYPILQAVFPFARRKSLLQEYFIPVEHAAEFSEEMKKIFQGYDVNVTNVSIRHVPKNDESYLSWSRKDSFAFVVYYTQMYGKDPAKELAIARQWTQQMLDKVLEFGGSFYPPYQLHARTDQFRRAFPGMDDYVKAKAKWDPHNKFSNFMIDTYILGTETFYFREMMESDFNQIELLAFFKNVFGVVQPEAHLKAIQEAYQTLKSRGIEINDRNMYEMIEKVLPKHWGNPVSRGLRSVKSLKTQQKEMADQTAVLLKSAGRTEFNGYVEIGTPGRYVSHLRNHKALKISGPIYVVHEKKPRLLSPEDIFERNGILRHQFVELNDYDMIAQKEIPNESLDLASVYIGLHHAPPQKLRQFVGSIHRVLRPGGLFVLRDHDVRSAALERMAHIAHSTFNAGLGVSFDAEVNDIRNFHALDYWIRLLKDSGFELASDERILQKGDPTLNTLLVFRKVRAEVGSAFGKSLEHMDKAGREELKSLPEYFRSGTHTYLVGPEWFWVDVYEEYASLQSREPWYRFPFTQFVNLAKKVTADHLAYARRHGIDDSKAFHEYEKMDRDLITANGIQFWLLQKIANFTSKSLRHERAPQVTGFVVEGIDEAQLAQFSDGLLKEVVNLKDDLTLLVTQRQMPFTKAMIELAAQEDVRLLEVAGNTDIGVLFVTGSATLQQNLRALSTLDEITSYQYPMETSSKGYKRHFHAVKIHVSELGKLIRTVRANGDEVMRVHDF